MARTKNKIDFRLLTKVSKLYYENNLNQDEIVSRLHISRSTISRLLAQARQEGIVRIVVIPPSGTYAELEAAIEEKYAINEVVVTDVPAPESPQMIARGLGAAAASYLLRVINETDVVGVSWGYTLRGMVASLEPKDFPNVRIVQMTGGIGKPESESHATELCHQLARTLSCKLALLPAPGVVHSKQTREVYLMDEHVRTAINLLPNITLAFVGIGSLNSYSISVRDETILTQADLDEAVANGAVGDIALRFIDANGQAVQSGLSERIIGIDLDHLRQIPRVVGVAGGTNKIGPIRAALRGKLLDVLITDQVTANILTRT
ncbi:MAG: sugar-binding transcriptional regulator [Chloroflexi bacterium]|nr:MAG: sugar-binding transcriptional regulator [Chloroflexota bacterium]